VPSSCGSCTVRTGDHLPRRWHAPKARISGAEGRRAQFIEEVRTAEGLTGAQASEMVDPAIDRWVWYAGWADKISQLLGDGEPCRRLVLRLHDPGGDRRRRRRRAGELIVRPPRLPNGHNEETIR